MAIAKGVGDVLDSSHCCSLNTRLSTQQSDLLEDAFSRSPAVIFLEDLCYT